MIVTVIKKGLRRLVKNLKYSRVLLKKHDIWW